MRSENINMLNETFHILEKGFYNINNTAVTLKLSKEQMREALVLLPEDVENICSRTDFQKVFCLGRCGCRCENKDSLEAARDLYEDYDYLFSGDSKPILVLNMANPVHPGGGVRKGARAQEEDLCRKSSLLLSLESPEAAKYYQYNKRLGTYMGSDGMIFSPQVEIIRGRDGSLLQETVTVAVLTCAAPMVRYGTEGMDEASYREMVYHRIMGMLKCAAYFGYKNLVLGAWGCGAFGNDAHVMSDLFYKALKEMEFNGMREKDFFRLIEFAVLDDTQTQYNFREFYRNFSYDNYYRDEKAKEIEEVLKRKKEKSGALDKIRGCLFGGAVGDALGYSIEFWNEKEIFQKYPQGLQEYVLDKKSGMALISDDTQMSLFTANGVLIADTRAAMRGIGSAPHHYVASAYMDWLLTQEQSFGYLQNTPSRFAQGYVSWLLDVPGLYSRRAPGNTCLSALYGRKKGGSFGSIDHPINSSKGCGGVMRVAPLALRYNFHGKLNDLDKEGGELAAITHGHPLGYMSAAVLVHIVNRIVYPSGKMSLKEIVMEALDTVNEVFSGEPYLNALDRIVRLAVSLSENNEKDIFNIHKLGEGWTGEEALAISIYCALKYENDFSAGVAAAVNHRGDSDSTGAVTGNILGALCGYEAIEEKWKRNLELSDVILEMADDLCYGCMMNEYSSYEDPDWTRKYVHMRWKENVIG